MRTRQGVATSLFVLSLSASGVDAGVVYFDDPRATIEVSGQTVIGAGSTYEAVFLLPDTVVLGQRVFTEWTAGNEDKQLSVHPGHAGGTTSSWGSIRSSSRRP